MTLLPHLTSVPEAREGLPLVVQARDRRLVPFLAWLREHRLEVLDALRPQGAVLIRGVDAASPERFEAIVRVLAPVLKRDYLGTSPRDAVTDHVFRASELPGHYPIPQHCEMTFVREPPRHLFFGCTVPPASFGETPLCDFRRVWTALDPAVREAFAARGVRVVRNYAPPGRAGGPFQLKDWPSMFGTTDREAVTRRALDEGFEPTFGPDGSLRLVSLHDAARAHPETGELAWFNHLQVFHAGTAASEYRRIHALRPTWRHWATWQLARALVARGRRVPPDQRAMHVTFRDGAEIPEAHVEHVRDVVWAHTVRVPWQRGDVLAIDNHSVAHGRMPYVGPREVVVAWS